jgi:hypothetical protein
MSFGGGRSLKWYQINCEDTEEFQHDCNQLG